LDPERRRIALSQAFHGGQVLAAAREFGLSHESILDFSSNLNVLAPTVSETEWEQWAADITRYPEPDAGTLANRLAEIYRLDGACILPTAGAIDGLYLTARLFRGCNVAIVEPGFSDYGRSFATLDCKLEHIILTRELWYAPAGKWTHLLEPFDVVVLGNPNNPTGSMQSRNELRHLLEMEWSRPKRWVIDEAFMEFAAGHDEETLLSIVEQFPSLIVLRSLTKSWRVPGLRAGFLATAGPIERLRAMQPPWIINSVVQAWAKRFLVKEHYAQLRETLSELRKVKQQFEAELRTIPGIHVHDGAANFFLVELVDGALEACSLYQRLGRCGLLIRVCDSFRGLAKGRFIRLSVRTMSENSRLAAELSTVCAELIRRAA
jgi:threonine-phosphate decarboxylase